jgi:DNA-binding response OmpR family regulator
MEERILIIEDSVDSWQLLSSIVRAHGYQPFWAPDGFHALSAARTHQPHVILLDLGLPAGDGFVVLQRLKRHRVLSAIPVIVVTVRDPAEAERQARKAGAIAFLQKPVTADALIATIRSVLGGKSERRSA